MILVVLHLFPCMLGRGHRCSLEICKYIAIVNEVSSCWLHQKSVTTGIGKWLFTIICANLTTYVARGVDSDFQAVIENLLLIIKPWLTQLKHVKLKRKTHGIALHACTHPIHNIIYCWERNKDSHRTWHSTKNKTCHRTYIYHEFFSSVLQASLYFNLLTVDEHTNL